MQLKQLEAPAFEYFPSGQLKQSSAPTFAWYRPAVQLEQALAELTEKVPAAQGPVTAVAAAPEQ